MTATVGGGSRGWFVFDRDHSSRLRSPVFYASGEELVDCAEVAHINGLDDEGPGPHDGMYPLQRFVHWMGDDDIDATY
jgi:hypothetical protein